MQIKIDCKQVRTSRRSCTGGRLHVHRLNVFDFRYYDLFNNRIDPNFPNVKDLDWKRNSEVAIAVKIRICKANEHVFY